MPLICSGILLFMELLILSLGKHFIPLSALMTQTETNKDTTENSFKFHSACLTSLLPNTPRLSRTEDRREPGTSLRLLVFARSVHVNDTDLPGDNTNKKENIFTPLGSGPYQQLSFICPPLKLNNSYGYLHELVHVSVILNFSNS